MWGVGGYVEVLGEWYGTIVKLHLHLGCEQSLFHSKSEWNEMKRNGGKGEAAPLFTFSARILSKVDTACIPCSVRLWSC